MGQLGVPARGGQGMGNDQHPCLRRPSAVLSSLSLSIRCVSAYVLELEVVAEGSVAGSVVGFHLGHASVVLQGFGPSTGGRSDPPRGHGGRGPEDLHLPRGGGRGLASRPSRSHGRLHRRSCVARFLSRCLFVAACAGSLFRRPPRFSLALPLEISLTRPCHVIAT